MTRAIDQFGCIGATIKVAAGHYVDLQNPCPTTIDLDSIAIGLGRECRFGNQCPKFYSVAEHLVHAASLAAAHGFTCDALKAVVMHDATEAYLRDLPKPLKNLLSEYKVIERRFELAIGERFGIDFDRWEPVIKRFDRAMLKAEKQAMWPNDAEQWTGFGEIEDVTVHLKFWSHERSEFVFRKYLDCLAIR